ncbi:hypothetical protein TRFO_23389 [Tritrichomonas foetus]|uniref:EF-hand domain-containing protein n=1 Tax=Tritrichomonas foetus TaxID=1144522 RepID=A0A1J4KAC8_9EUKA|nr:hypothetical protein TRFO_23389 [Tritrichomonas foetus]|eukprot:OHT08179.1 hypothetical protein TRFO_23389 [Tritrichomonas foetus]
MCDLNELRDRIRTHLYLNTALPTDWFEDFDKLRSGRVTNDQFRRCFQFIRFSLSDAEYEALRTEYADRGMVNYRRFLDDVQNVFSNKDLERDPHGTTMDSRSVVMRTTGRTERSLDRELGQLLQKLAHQVTTRGVHIRESYEDFDRNNNGRVTQSQFFRAMPFRDLNQQELMLLVKFYADPILRDVNYRQLNSDVNDVINNVRHLEPNTGFITKTGQPRFLPHQLQSFKLKSATPPGDDLLERFATMVREQRIRIRDFFQAHDPLNIGVITPNKFESTLTLFGFNFTESDLKYLNERYHEVRDRTDYVRYKEFCTDIEQRADGELLTAKNRNVIVPTPEFDAIIEKIKFTINRSRINILPTLTGFDRLKRGFITAPQFHRALSTLQIFISTAELNVLVNSYGNETEVDYFKFVEDVDPQHSQHRREYKPIGTSKESIDDVYGHTPTGDRFVTPDQADEMIYKSKRGLIRKIDEHRDIQSLLTEMKRWSIVNSVIFSDFFKDFDHFNFGEIPVSQFRSGMSISTFQLTEDEFDLIVDNYSSDTRPGFIMWRKFSEDVLSAVAPIELEKAPTVTPIAPRDTVLMNTQGYQNRTPPKNVTRLLEIIARYVKSRRIALMEQFKDKDALNHKRITASHFAQVVQLIGVHISKPEIDVLCTYYNDPKTNFIDYSLFVEDVDKLVGQIFGDRASSSIVVKPIPAYGNEKNCPYLVSQLSTAGHVFDWNEICSKLQTFVYKRRVRLEDFFLAFDFHHMGFVTKQKFRSVVGQTDLPLTSEQIDICLEHFTVPGQDDLFNYRDFCNDINQIFYVSELNRKPLDNGLAKSQALPDPSSTLQRLCEADEEEIARILKRMRYMVLTRRMNIREQFTDYDHHPRKNYITKQQFKQSIARSGLSTNPSEFEVLCKKYRCTDLDDMNYQQFCNDIDAVS